MEPGSTDQESSAVSVSSLARQQTSATPRSSCLVPGLGVDDAFVLCAEFSRATKDEPEAEVHERCAKACRRGGVSIFVTSRAAYGFGQGCAHALVAPSSPGDQDRRIEGVTVCIHHL